MFVCVCVCVHACGGGVALCLCVCVCACERQGLHPSPTPHQTDHRFEPLRGGSHRTHRPTPPQPQPLPPPQSRSRRVKRRPAGQTFTNTREPGGTAPVTLMRNRLDGARRGEGWAGGVCSAAVPLPPLASSLCPPWVPPPQPPGTPVTCGAAPAASPGPRR